MQIYTPYSSESFSNYQGPVILVGVALILAFQYVRGVGFFGEDKDEKLEAMKRKMGKGKKGKKTPTKLSDFGIEGLERFGIE